MIDIDKLTANDQIQAMGKLTQQAAGWLAGLSARSIRDHPQIPRDGQGRYDAREVLQWVASRAKPVSLADDEINRSLNLADAMVDQLDGDNDGLVLAASEFLCGLRDRHGDSGLALFAVELCKVLKEAADRLQADAQTPAQIESEIRREVERRSPTYQVKQGQQALDRVSVCGDCSRWRKGAEWVKGDPPEGAGTIESACPSCLE